MIARGDFRRVLCLVEGQCFGLECDWIHLVGFGSFGFWWVVLVKVSWNLMSNNWMLDETRIWMIQYVCFVFVSSMICFISYSIRRFL